MLFVGLVTRRDKDCGTILRAKVVSSNKKVCKFKDFRVKIKPNGMDDATACMYDVQYAKEALQGYNLDELSTDIAMIAYGPNGSTISYDIQDGNSGPLLSQYLNADGTQNGRPKYGDTASNAEGSIRIIANKNDASSTALVNATIPSYTYDDVLREVLSADLGATIKSNLWGYICNGDNNRNYSDTNISASNHNITQQLKLNDVRLDSQYVSLKKFTDLPIKISWDIEDDFVTDSNFGTLNTDIQNAILPSGANIRIKKESNGYGTIVQPSYTDAYAVKNNAYLERYAQLTGDSLEQRAITISGIRVIPKIIIGSHEPYVLDPLLCSISSKHLTNNEMGAVYQNVQKIFKDSPNSTPIAFDSIILEHTAIDVDYQSTFNASTTFDSPQTLTLYMYAKEGFSNCEYDALGITQGALLGTDVDITYKGVNTSTEYPTYNGRQVVNEIFQDAYVFGENTSVYRYKVISVDLNRMRSAYESSSKNESFLTFTIIATMNITNYRGDTSPRRVQISKTITVRFQDTNSP